MLSLQSRSQTTRSGLIGYVGELARNQRDGAPVDETGGCIISLVGDALT